MTVVNRCMMAAATHGSCAAMQANSAQYIAAEYPLIWNC